MVGIEKNNDHSGTNEKIENKLSKFYTSESKKSNLKYFYYISKSNYQSLNILIYGLSIFSILLCIIVFILLIISIYKKKYIPLLKIKEKLDSKIIGSSNMSDQELIKKIDKLKIEDDSKIDLLSKRYVINETFRRIINGIHNEKEVSDIFSKYSLDLNNKKLTTIIIKSDSFNELVNELKESNMEKEIMALCDKRISLIKEYYSSFKEIVIVEEEKEVILIVSSDIDDSDELIIKKIKESSNKYQERLRNDYSIDSIIAIGIPVIEIDKINESYKKALSTREFIELLGSTNEIASYFSLYDRGTLSIDILPYKDLRDMIRLKDFEKAKKQTIYVIDKEIISNDKKELMIKMYSFIDRLNTEITGAISNYSPRFIKELDVTRKLMNVTSIKELKETTNEIYDSIIRNQGNITDDEFIWIEKVKEYIRLNYSDKSLSVSALADEFHFSLSYFSRMFKLKTGYGINEFINEVRIDEAKAMLKKGMTVIEVSEKCGFMDSRSLIRTFKSFYGDTPSKYKNK